MRYSFNKQETRKLTNSYLGNISEHTFSKLWNAPQIIEDKVEEFYLVHARRTIAS